MRKHGRTDANQLQIVRELRQLGVSVLSLADLGHGVPDLLCGWRKTCFLFELKDPLQPPSKRRLTEDEQLFHDTWNGHIKTVHSLQEILEDMQK